MRGKINKYLLILITVAISSCISLYANVVWNDDNYKNLTAETFSSSPQANKIIDLNNLDYQLMGAAVFFATNEVRTQNGLAPFKYASPLYKAAFMHTKDMADHGFMGHNSPLPGKGHVKQRVKMFHPKGISWYGENIAFMSYRSLTYLQLGRQFVANWMTSPGHRANILRDKFNYLGAACFYNKNNGSLLATQVFAGRLR